MCRPRLPPTWQKNRAPRAEPRRAQESALAQRDAARATPRAPPALAPSRHRHIATSPSPPHAPHIPLLLRARAERALARARESARARARARDPSTLAPSTHSLSRETARARPRAHDPRRARAREIIYPAIPLFFDFVFGARARAPRHASRRRSLPLPRPRALAARRRDALVPLDQARARAADRSRSRSDEPLSLLRADARSPRSTTAPDPPPSPRATSLVGPPRTTRLLTRSEAQGLATLSARANGSLYRAGVTADAAPAPSRHGPPRDAGGRRALAGADGARSRRSAGGARELRE